MNAGGPPDRSGKINQIKGMLVLRQCNGRRTLLSSKMALVAAVLMVWGMTSWYFFFAKTSAYSWQGQRNDFGATRIVSVLSTPTPQSGSEGGQKIQSELVIHSVQIISHPQLKVIVTFAHKLHSGQQPLNQSEVLAHNYLPYPKPPNALHLQNNSRLNPNVSVSSAHQERNNSVSILQNYLHSSSTSESVNTTNLNTQASVLHSTPKPVDAFDPTKPVICHTFSPGRLGNHLFEYASILGIAAKTDKTFYFSNGEILQGVLKHLPVVGLPPETHSQMQARCRRAVRLSDKMPCQFEKTLLSLKPGVDYNIGEYLQSWWYFDGFQEQIRAALTFSDDIVRNASVVVNFLRQTFPNTTLVGIHNRRGDLTRDAAVREGYLTAPKEYFQRAMAYFRGRFSPIKFIVAGDDKEWDVANIEPLNDEVIHLVKNSPAVDLQILSMTDHMIRTVGTYGWWAAFKMSGGATVVSLKEFGKGEQRKFYSPTAEDYMLPGWILM